MDDSEESLQNEIELVKIMEDVSGDSPDKRLQGNTRHAVNRDKTITWTIKFYNDLNWVFRLESTLELDIGLVVSN